MKTRCYGMLILGLMLVLSGCKSDVGNVRGGSGDGESRYADKQSREAYINSPAYINVKLGIEYMRQGELNIALSKLKKALYQSPQLAIAHNTIAILYARIGEIELAEDHFERSISLDSTDSRLRNNYGRFLCRHRSSELAIAQFDIAAGNPLYPTPYLPLVNAGICSLNDNKLVQADTYLRRALTLQPKLALALANMMKLSVLENKHLQGRAYLQRYLEVGKHTADTLWYGYQIEKKLGDIKTANNYAVRLKTRHPDSEQTKQLLDHMNMR